MLETVSFTPSREIDEVPKDASVVQAALVSAEKMKIFLYQHTNNCPSEVHDVVGKANNCLEIQQAYLRDLEDQTGGSCSLRKDQEDCVDISNEIQDVLDNFMFELFRVLLHGNKLPLKIANSSFRKVCKESQRKLSDHIERTLTLLDGKQSNRDYIAGAGRRSTSSDQLSKEIPEKDVVGFVERKEKLIDQLVEEDPTHPTLSTIGIVGMGGCGKTTLAKIVYESIRVRDHFDCQAWVDASHPLRYTDVLSVLRTKLELHSEEESEFTDALGDLPAKHELHGEEEAETDKRAKLRPLQKGRKFLVVLDDIWSHQDCSQMQHALTKAGANGSRIVITSRHSHIVSLSSHFIHDLSSGLSDSGAWELFCKKACQVSLDSLEKWPEKFVKLCEGLPLAISTIGTWLAGTAPIPHEWRTKYNYLRSELRMDYSKLSVLSRNLEQGYNDLPSQLKSCFLYLSMFPEDYSISREILLRLWVAEGFVMPDRGITVEQVAESYLNELIARNLIVVTAREGDGGRVRRCRVLHLVRQINISRQKRFATVLDENYELSSEPDLSHRLFLNKGCVKMINGRAGCFRSFLMFGKESSRRELQTVFKTNKFLKVLDLNGAALSKFPKSVVGLYLLKYLSLRNTQIKVVPNSIGNLLSLETLDLKHTKVSKLPPGIRKLQRLRHLLVFEKNMGSGGVTTSARNISALSSSIQKLSFIKVETNRRILKALGGLTGLRKLGLTDLKEEYGEEFCGYIEKMQHLSTLDISSISEDEYLDLDHMCYPLVAPLYLQHLYLRGPLVRVPQWISELTSLTKLGLKFSKLRAQANPLEAIQALPNLIELDLVNYYTGGMLIFKAETFLKLVKLTIKQFKKLNYVEVQPGAMPVLKNLAIWSCQNLKNLPAGIGSLTLKEFLLYDMPHELIAKLRRNGDDRQLVKHIGVIRSYYKGEDGIFKVMGEWYMESSDHRF